jgi:hypothetical protein
MLVFKQLFTFFLNALFHGLNLLLLRSFLMMTKMITKMNLKMNQLIGEIKQDASTNLKDR